MALAAEQVDVGVVVVDREDVLGLLAPAFPLGLLGRVVQLLVDERIELRLAGVAAGDSGVRALLRVVLDGALVLGVDVVQQLVSCRALGARRHAERLLVRTLRVFV